MKKSEISARGLEDRSLFLQSLANAGWDVEDWDKLLETGANVEPEAEAAFAGPIFNLHLEYHASLRYLVLEMAQPEGELVLRLRLHPIDDLAPHLERIIAVQDTLDTDNHPELVQSLIPFCEPLLIETEEGLYRLT